MNNIWNKLLVLVPSGMMEIEVAMNETVSESGKYQVNGALKSSEKINQRFNDVKLKRTSEK